MAENGKQKWIYYLVSLLATIALAIFTFMGNKIYAVDQCSQARDEKIVDKFDFKYDDLQKEMRIEFSNVKENQATLLARQNMVIETLKEIKTKIQ